MSDITKPGTPSTIAASDAAARAAEAAGRAALAVARAAENATAKGSSSSEFRVTVLAMLTTGGLAALHALAVIPGPWQLPAALGLGLMGAAGIYANSRGRVKAAALAAAATTGSGPIHLPMD